MNKKRNPGFMIAVIVLLSVPLIILILCSVTGDGITFESISASMGTRRALGAMKAGDYDQSAKHIDFLGLNEDRTTINSDNIEDERLRFIEGLEGFFGPDMSMVGYEILNSMTEDGYTIVTTRIVLVDRDQPHSFILRLSKHNGRLCPMGVIVDVSDHATADVAEAFIDIVQTHYPG